MAILSTLKSQLQQWIRSSPRSELSASTPPRSVEWLLAHRGQRNGAIQQRQQSRRRGARNDTAIASLYRMYVDIVDDFTVELRNEIEYFFNRSEWSVCDIPDPKDPDPKRYAILAVLPHLLVPAFNRLIERGLPRNAPAIIDDLEELQARPKVLEVVPSWCDRVPSLKITLSIPNDRGELLVDVQDKRASPEFLAKNILAFRHHTFFV